MDIENIDDILKTAEEPIVDDYKDKYLRSLADFENLKKRTAKERIELISNAEEKLIISLLSILDDVSRLKKSNIYDGLDEGIKLIFDKFEKTLLNKGLSKIKCIGESFNSDIHEAISQIHNDEMVGKVIDVVEDGFYLNDKMIRAAKVLVGV